MSAPTKAAAEGSIARKEDSPGDKGGGGWHMNRGKPSSWVNAYRSEYCVKRRFEAPSGASMGMVNTGKGVAAVVFSGHAPGYEGEYLLG